MSKKRLIPEDLKEAAEFIKRFRLTRRQLKHAPTWELLFMIERGKEDKIPRVREYIKWIGGKVL